MSLVVCEPPKSPRLKTTVLWDISCCLCKLSLFTFAIWGSGVWLTANIRLVQPPLEIYFSKINKLWLCVLTEEEIVLGTISPVNAFLLHSLKIKKTVRFNNSISLGLVMKLCLFLNIYKIWTTTNNRVKGAGYFTFMFLSTQWKKKATAIYKYDVTAQDRRYQVRRETIELIRPE